MKVENVQRSRQLLTVIYHSSSDNLCSFFDLCLEIIPFDEKIFDDCVKNKYQ